MIKPIVAFGDPVLKAEAEDISEDLKGLSKLIEDMWETMYAAEGVGLAAPQVGESIRMFITDGTPFSEGEDGDKAPNNFIEDSNDEDNGSNAEEDAAEEDAAEEDAAEEDAAEVEKKNPTPAPKKKVVRRKVVKKSS